MPTVSDIAAKILRIDVDEAQKQHPTCTGFLIALDKNSHGIALENLPNLGLLNIL